MGKFLNSTNTRTSMTNMVTSIAKSKLNNPYYLFNNQPAVVVTYYNINTTMTTLDEVTRSNYGTLNANDPIKFNKVSGFYLYGINQIQPQLEVNDYGLEGSEISGDGIVLPYTLTPFPGDYFYIEELGSNYLFKVTEANPNTLDTGTTMYRINYVLANSDSLNGDIENQVVKKYNFVASNMGTNFSCFMEEDTYTAISDLEDLSTTLKDYYISLFYDAKIQSFAYAREEAFFKVYDPYLVEFLVRNDVLSGSSEYLYINQEMYLPQRFVVDYDRTFFRSIEEGDIATHIGTYIGNLFYVDQKLSLLYAYPIDYYYMEYRRVKPSGYIINIFNDPGFNKRIENNESNPNNVFKDIIIGYMNGEDITDDQLTRLEHVDYAETMELFYCLPMTIYIIDQTISGMFSSSTSGDDGASDGDSTYPAVNTLTLS